MHKSIEQLDAICSWSHPVYFQQDGAPYHTSGSAFDWIDECVEMITITDWPPMRVATGMERMARQWNGRQNGRARLRRLVGVDRTVTIWRNLDHSRFDISTSRCFPMVT
jgi:hypothetical protein